MSLNHIASMSEENKWCNIKCNNISLGTETRLKAQSIVNNTILDAGNVNFSESPLFYTSDYNSLNCKGFVVYTSVATPMINFNARFLIPTELRPRFSNIGGLTAITGCVVEHSSPTGINNGNLTSANVVGDYIEYQVIYRQVQSSVVNFRIYYDITVYNFNA